MIDKIFILKKGSRRMKKKWKKKSKIKSINVNDNHFRIKKLCCLFIFYQARDFSKLSL